MGLRNALYVLSLTEARLISKLNPDQILLLITKFSMQTRVWKYKKTNYGEVTDIHIVKIVFKNMNNNAQYKRTLTHMKTYSRILLKSFIVIFIIITGNDFFFFFSFSFCENLAKQ